MERQSWEARLFLLTDRPGSVSNLELTEVDTVADLGIL